MIKFSPNKRFSSSNYPKLNISNIQKDRTQDTIDEEDNSIIGRIIQKYQRDFNNLNHGTAAGHSSASNLLMNKKKFKTSNNSQSTLNLNSHDT